MVPAFTIAAQYSQRSLLSNYSFAKAGCGKNSQAVTKVGVWLLVVVHHILVPQLQPALAVQD